MTIEKYWEIRRSKYIDEAKAYAGEDGERDQCPLRMSIMVRLGNNWTIPEIYAGLLKQSHRLPRFIVTSSSNDKKVVLLERRLAHC
jgi:hypothetical protein